MKKSILILCMALVSVMVSAQNDKKTVTISTKAVCCESCKSDCKKTDCKNCKNLECKKDSCKNADCKNCKKDGQQANCNGKQACCKNASGCKDASGCNGNSTKCCKQNK